MRIAATANDALDKEKITAKWPAATTWIWVEDVGELSAHEEVDLYLDMAFRMDKTRIEVLSQLSSAPVMINSMVHTIQEIGHPFIRINGWPGVSEKQVHELAAPADAAAKVTALYEKWKIAYRIVPDIPGMISGRIISMIVNEAYYTLQEEVSTKGEIDTAMKLGTNYPYGPFEWSELIGLEDIHSLLVTLSDRDIRYQPARLLTESLVAD